MIRFIPLIALALVAMIASQWISQRTLGNRQESSS